LTSSLKYAELYSKQAAETVHEPAFVIAAVIPGNSFPVVEPAYLNREIEPIRNSGGFLGNACRPGYQSHSVIGMDSILFLSSCVAQVEPSVTIVNLTDFPDCHPLTPWNPMRNSNAVDELVVQPSQALPLFVVKLKPLPEDTKSREIAVEYHTTSSVLEIEPLTVDSVDYSGCGVF